MLLNQRVKHSIDQNSWWVAAVAPHWSRDIRWFPGSDPAVAFLIHPRPIVLVILQVKVQVAYQTDFETR